MKRLIIKSISHFPEMCNIDEYGRKWNELNIKLDEYTFTKIKIKSILDQKLYKYGKIFKQTSEKMILKKIRKTSNKSSLKKE